MVIQICINTDASERNRIVLLPLKRGTLKKKKTKEAYEQCTQSLKEM